MDVKAITTGRLRLDFAWSTPTSTTLRMSRVTLAANRGQAIVIDLIANMASIVANGDGTDSYTFVQVPPPGFDNATLGKGLLVVLEGRRVMPDGSEAYPDGAFAFSGGAPRETLFDQAKCETCHKQRALHGGSRAGDPMICAACHSSSLGGTSRREQLRAPWRSAPSSMACIPATSRRSAPVTYPQSLARCEGCHVAGKFNVARTTALPITVDAGTTLSTGAATLAWQDDRADSATAGTCKGCHTSATAATHMETQGGSFGVAKTLVPSSSAEGCVVCHGPGQTSTLKKCTVRRCPMVSARRDRKNRNDTTFHDTFHDAPAALLARAGCIPPARRPESHDVNDA